METENKNWEGGSVKKVRYMGRGSRKIYKLCWRGLPKNVSSFTKILHYSGTQMEYH